MRAPIDSVARFCNALLDRVVSAVLIAGPDTRIGRARVALGNDQLAAITSDVMRPLLKDALHGDRYAEDRAAVVDGIYGAEAAFAAAIIADAVKGIGDRCPA